MNIFVIAPQHIRERMCESNRYVPEKCPWKDYMDASERIVLMVQYMADWFKTEPFLEYAKQTNRKVELYFLNKEEL